MKSLLYTGSGERIDSWLTKQFSYSRNFFQHILERGGVTVLSAKSSNTLAIGLKVKKSYKLQDGDQVVIESLERFLDGGILDECPEVEIRNKIQDMRYEIGANTGKIKNDTCNAPYLEIMLEKKEYMVIYKSKGILSHPNSVRDISNPSVVGGLYHYFQKNEQNSLSIPPGKERIERGVLPTTGNFIRAGLIHRLDKDTDGLMLIAKTEIGLEYFKHLFQKKSAAESIEEKETVPLKKYYQALCEITPQGQSFLQTINKNLPYIIQEDVVPKTPHPVIKEGITKILSFKTLQHGNTATLDLEILTGRTHQIRYHLSHHGLPIVGDYLYGTEDPCGLQLTAKRLIFLDNEGEEVSISI